MGQYHRVTILSRFKLCVRLNRYICALHRSTTVHVHAVQLNTSIVKCCRTVFLQCGWYVVKGGSMITYHPF